MPVDKSDLKDLRDDLKSIIENESAQTRSTITALDDRQRQDAIVLAQHGVRLDKVEESDRDQWTEIGRLRNGRASAGAPQSRGREAAKVTAVLTLIAALVEGLHQIVGAIAHVFSVGGKP